MTATVFIDGEAGTTGLGIRERLDALSAFKVLSIDHDKRKDPQARKEMMAEVDAVVLCLPDDAAKESASLAKSLGGNGPKVLDASTAHRVAEGWAYGFAEMAPGQADAIRKAQFVSNPGCYPTGAIALIRPLVDVGLLPADHPVAVNAVSGYSGGGKSMIEAFETGKAPSFELYGLGLEHKHVPEIQLYGALKRRPIFVPSVGNFRQGMLVSLPLHLDTLPGQPTPAALEAALAERFAGSEYVSVVPAGDPAMKGGKLEPEALNDTNKLELRVYGNATRGHAILVARLDNLGKGASGAAVQNLQLMLGMN
ncbi:N-acetyl-gamma-glutamyl-phosphate reductase [uncultured Alsobacter sp.]|uniref:N-acetyl-gamma-glutamyl-phosphate reductase n=1 Tax=uncultured Alsobacter sp. TaxID=1748258 RepID=UPI0025D9F26B|nr:N-acetyl-gamma-glutamyl-phosphate reductase [uncultured Alsobacter sp.]